MRFAKVGIETLKWPAPIPGQNTFGMICNADGTPGVSSDISARPH